MKPLLFTIGFISLFFFVDFISPIASPILGPAFMLGLVIGLVYLMFRLATDDKKN